MKPIIFYFLFLALTHCYSCAQEIVNDIFQDHLHGQDIERSESIGDLDLNPLIHLSSFEVDIDGDGVAEVLVGYNPFWTGANFYSTSIYQKIGKSFQRLNPPSQDVELFLGSFEFNLYIGYVDAFSASGILDLSPAGDYLHFVSIDGGKTKVVLQEGDEVDSNLKASMLKNGVPQSGALESRSVKLVERKTSEVLIAEGYEIPDWRLLSEASGSGKSHKKVPRNLESEKGSLKNKEPDAKIRVNKSLLSLAVIIAGIILTIFILLRLKRK